MSVSASAVPSAFGGVTYALFEHGLKRGLTFSIAVTPPRLA
jgi:hypothetical protein